MSCVREVVKRVRLTQADVPLVDAALVTWVVVGSAPLRNFYQVVSTDSRPRHPGLASGVLDGWTVPDLVDTRL